MYEILYGLAAAFAVGSTIAFFTTAFVLWRS